MKRLPLVVTCLFLATALCWGQAKESKQIFSVDFPMDAKTDGPPARGTIHYSLFDDGSAYSVNNFRLAHQSSEERQLTKSDLETVQHLIDILPACVKAVSKDHSVTVSRLVDGKTEHIIYDKDNLPLTLKTILISLGGVRAELDGNINFVENIRNSGEK